MKRLLTLLLLLFPLSAFAAMPVGSTPSALTLAGEDGGLVAGGEWSSSSLKGKMTLLFYVDPDEKKLNDEATTEFKKHPKDLKKFQSVAVINMDATWLPNGAIQSSLEKKQKEFPDTIYVMDKTKKLVKEWSLGDDNNDITLLDADGKVLFSKDGELTPEEIQKLVELIGAYAGI